MTEHNKKLTHATIKINNMVCTSCETIIEKSVKKKNGIERINVDYNNGEAKVTYDSSKATLKEIYDAVREAGYEVVEGDEKRRISPTHIALGIFVAIMLVFGYLAVSSTLEGMNISIPQIDAGTSAIIIFFVGLLTGFHCIGMCGGFVLGYTAEARKANPKSLNLGAHAQYSIGKIISYSIIGGIFGLVGSIFVFSPTLRAMIAIIAGIFLIFYALKMLNVHPSLRKLSLPRGLFDRLRIGPLKKSSNPLAIGLANGLFIACGPLQAMYILAMATGSFTGGAIILFAFAIGTLIPMMGFGIFASFISRGMQNSIVRISAIIVLVMGILMINNGLVLTGNNVTSIFATPNLNASNTQGNNTNLAISNNPADSGTQTSNGPGYQVINMDVVGTGYSPNSFVLKTGVPVKWVINGKEVTGCNGGIIVPAYNLDFKIKKGIQTIEFTPTKAGTINWSCWMGMIPGQFIVRDDVSIDKDGKVVLSPAIEKEAVASAAAAPKASGHSCGCGMKSA